MKILTFIGEAALRILALISIVMILAYVYFLIFVDETTIGVNNVGDQLALDVKAEADLTEEEKDEYAERWFMEANYYSNANNNGIELQELKMNYFMSPRLLQEDYRASGLQATSNCFDAELLELGKKVPFYYYQYDTVNGISYDGSSTLDSQSGQGVSTSLKPNTEYIIKIDNRPFTINLDATYETGWWIFKETKNYNFSHVFMDVMKAIETNSAGYGDYYVTLDLSNYFSIKEMDENGQFKADNVTDIIKNYAVLKFHYDENGAIYSNQSMFGKIENNSKYDKTTVEYWSGKMVYSLTEKDFSYRYVEYRDGYFISLSNEVKAIFDDMTNFELNIDIDLNSLYLQKSDKKILGFDFNALSGLDIKTLTITGKATDFMILDNAFSDATLKTLRHSSGINFLGEFGIEFEEVIL